MTKLLRSAGLAIRALTNSATTETSSDETSRIEGSLEAHQTAFKTATAQYFALVSSIDVRLRRQVYALEEASIIQPESSSRANESTGGSAVTPGASNPLEISWLNSRKDNVEKDKEAELWAEARKFTTQLTSSSSPSQADYGSGSGGEGATGALVEEMEMG